MRPERYKTKIYMCPQTLEIIKDKPIRMETLDFLRRLKPERQVAVADHIVASGNYSLTFSRALAESTPSDEFVYMEHLRTRKDKQHKAWETIRKRVAQENIALLVGDLKRARQSYGRDMLTLCVCLKYVQRILANPQVEWYLRRFHPKQLSTLRLITADTSSVIPAA